MPTTPPRRFPDTTSDTAGPGDAGGVVLPFRRPSTRDHPWRVDDIDTEPLTSQQHDQAVSALAALIGQWRGRHHSHDGNDKAA